MRRKHNNIPIFIRASQNDHFVVHKYNVSIRPHKMLREHDAMYVHSSYT